MSQCGPVCHVKFLMVIGIKGLSTHFFEVKVEAKNVTFKIEKIVVSITAFPKVQSPEQNL